MIAGMTTFTLFHVVLSLIGIVSGLVVVRGMISGRRLDGATLIFLVTTAATSVTGFMFPYHGITPGIVVGILSLLVLGVAIFARYSSQLAGGWRRTYVITTMIALYFNVFVLVVQLFEKVPALHALAPKGSEPPFAVTQVIVMVIFIALGIAAAKGFRQPIAMVRDRSERAA
ncbi:MAG: hypothetical protein ABSB87_13610 [Terriglobales bacterium]|jgi:hypothetical protein